MVREYRVLHTLEGTQVPHATVLGYCDDPAVLGACFYVMELVHGFTPNGPFPPTFTDLGAQRAFGLAMIDSLAELHTLDWRAIGLEGFGHPDGFLARQVERWLGHLVANRTETFLGSMV